MVYSEEQLIEDIQEGGARQEKAIRQLYEHCFYLVGDGRNKFRHLDDDDEEACEE